MSAAALQQTVDLSRYSSAEIAAALWVAGRLDYKLRAYQRELYRDVKAALWGDGGYANPTGKHRRALLEIHRRFGKSHVIGILACELCVSKPGARVYWAAETQKQVTRFLIPLLNRILRDCPDHLRPRWYRTEGELRWPNGSVIMLQGCEDEAKCDRLRGDACDMFVVDEAGSIDMLDYLYKSVVLWMLSTTNGRALLPSTPARSPGHPFTSYCTLAEAGEGYHAHRDVYASGFSVEQIAELAKECGGENTAAWRREGLALRVVDAERAIFPEFSEPGIEDNICRPYCKVCGVHYDKHPANDNGHEFVWEVERPEFFDGYVAMDYGHSPDLTAIGAGYYDFKPALYVITHEAELSQPSSIDVANALTVMERDAFGEQAPYRRVSDVAPLLLLELARHHGIEVQPTRKDDKEAQINDVRVSIAQCKWRIHPRCKKLRAHLKAGIWNDKRTSYARMPGFGHFDFCDMIIYFRRNVDVYNNPYPVRVETHPWRRAKQLREPQVPEHMREVAQTFGAVNRALFPSKRK